MIVLRCSNCKRVQELENAFAGCVCRCRFCRAIQTVPDDCPRATAGQEPALSTSVSKPPVLLHCPEVRSKSAAKAVGVTPQRADRTLIFAVGIAAVLALGAAGGAFALFRSLEDDRSPSPSTGGSEMNRVRFDSAAVP